MSENVSLEGTWKLVVKGPAGAQPTVLVIENKNGELSGTQTGQGSTSPVTDVKVNGADVEWTNHVTKPMKLKVVFTGKIEGNSMAGKCKVGFMGSFNFTATKEG